MKKYKEFETEINAYKDLIRREKSGDASPELQVELAKQIRLLVSVCKIPISNLMEINAEVYDEK